MSEGIYRSFKKEKMRQRLIEIDEQIEELRAEMNKLEDEYYDGEEDEYNQ